MKQDYDNYSLFNLEDSNGIEVTPDVLEIVDCSFKGNRGVTWREMFEGFNELRVITFSSGIDFTNKVLEMFDYAEIIYGCSGIINSKLADIIAMQESIIEVISKSKAIRDISRRVGENSLKLYVSMDTNSHEKIFLLKASDGRTRVITGSANMSASAFCGFQRENIMCFDDYEAYDYFLNRYEKYKEKCSNRIEPSLIKKVELNKHYVAENIEEVPILEETNQKMMISIVKSKDEPDYVQDIKKISDEINPLLPKSTSPVSSIKITTETVKVVKKGNRDLIEKKNNERHIPKLHIDFDEWKLYFNQKPLNMHPTEESIKNDIKSIIDFLDGFRSFNGKVLDAQKDYFLYMNWFFASIFIPELRLSAFNNGYSLVYFPIFGMLCGPSNAGKTSFVKLLSKLMTGKTILPATNDKFSDREINKLRENAEGVPIMIEDLAKSQYDNNYEKIIKKDEFGFLEGNVHYPAVSITANKIASLTQDISKRVVYFRSDISTDKETGARNAKIVNECIRAASSALFCEYTRRMMPIVKGIENNMIKGDKNYSPDLLKASSQVLVEIFSEYSRDIPEYIRNAAWADYFGDTVVGKTAMERIRDAWKTQPSSFKRNKKDNQLTYRVPDNAAYELSYLVNELPAILNAKKQGGMLIMDLDAATQLFNNRFKKGLF